MTPDTTRRKYLRTLGAVGLAGSSLAVAGCSAPSDGGDTPTATAEPTEPSDGNGDDGFVQTDTVDMTDELTFEPQRIEVSAGTTVTWVNVGTIGHTVTAYEDEIPEDATYFASGGYESEQAARDGYPGEGNLAEGESYEHTFETPGDYEYLCVPHELNGMVGTVRVT